jgi:hypothetical protein
MSAPQEKLRQPDYVDHMLEAIRLIQGYVEGMRREEFLADRKTQEAVIMNILAREAVSVRGMKNAPGSLLPGAFQIAADLTPKPSPYPPRR